MPGFLISAIFAIFAVKPATCGKFCRKERKDRKGEGMQDKVARLAYSKIDFSIPEI